MLKEYQVAVYAASLWQHLLGIVNRKIGYLVHVILEFYGS